MGDSPANQVSQHVPRMYRVAYRPLAAADRRWRTTAHWRLSKTTPLPPSWGVVGQYHLHIEAKPYADALRAGKFIERRYPARFSGCW